MTEANQWVGRIISSEKDRYKVALLNHQNRTQEGEDFPSGSIFYCKGRGVFRSKGKEQTPVVGDIVDFAKREDSKEGVILSIHKRKSLLLRPMVANVDQVLVVQSLSEPAISALAFDKILVMVESKTLPLLIGFTKKDKVSNDFLKAWTSRYEKANYPVYAVNSIKGEGISSIRQPLEGKITAIAGPSGVGKSTLIAALTGYEGIEIGQISLKSARGKQTTRRVDLYQLNSQSFIYDTPGFSSLELKNFVKALDASECFPEIRERKGACRFRNCTHRKEPDCAVKKAVEAGEIDPLRYQSYLSIYQEIEKHNAY